MGFEANIIEFLQPAADNFFSTIMLILTHLGDELFFMIVAVVLYWCVNKRYAFKFANIYLLSVVATESIKNIVKRPRPFDKYEGRVRSIGDKTGGYSFPSGHTTSVASMCTQMNIALYKTKYKRHALIIGISLTVIVMFTRLYLGQHYLTDVLAGLILSVGLAFLLNYLFSFLGEREHLIFIVALPLCVILLFVLSATGSASSAPNVLKVAGAYSAFTTGYFIEKKYVRFDVKSNRFYKQIIKAVVGLGIALALKEGLKLILPEDIAELYQFLRYFLIALWAALGASFIFKLCRL